VYFTCIYILTACYNNTAVFCIYYRYIELLLAALCARAAGTSVACGGTMAQRACAACGEAKARGFFSASQWRKGLGRSRCTGCVAAPAAPAPAATGPRPSISRGPRPPRKQLASRATRSIPPVIWEQVPPADWEEPRRQLGEHIKEKNWDKATELAFSRDWPQLCAKLDSDQYLPLHAALAHSYSGHPADDPATEAEAAFIVKLIEKHPPAVLQAVPPDGFTALHLLTLMQFAETEDGDKLTQTVLQALLHAAPDGLLASDRNGSTPLLWSLHHQNWSKSLWTSRAMLRACPAAAAVPNNAGEVPLHHAVGLHVWTEKWCSYARELHDAAPQAVCVEAGRGYTPLHYACMNQCIKLLPG
jgi:hypothetical protein